MGRGMGQTPGGGTQMAAGQLRGRLTKLRERAFGSGQPEGEADEHSWHQGGQEQPTGPAVETHDDFKIVRAPELWYKDGKLHRADGSTIEREDERYELWFEALRYRKDSPEGWYQDGQEQSTGPAVQENDPNAWHLNGQEQSTGPAVQEDDPNAWHLNGQEQSTGPAVQKELSNSELLRVLNHTPEETRTIIANLLAEGEKSAAQMLYGKNAVGAVVASITPEKGHSGVLLDDGRDVTYAEALRLQRRRRRQSS